MFNKLKYLFIVFPLLLSACGGSSDENGVHLNSIDIGESFLPPPSSDFPSIPSDADIEYNGPYTCGEYRVAPDKRLLDYGFTDEVSYHNYKVAFDIAVNYWNNALGEKLFVEVDDDKCVKTDINTRVDLDWFDITKSGVVHPESTGAYTRYPKPNGSQCSCVIYINPNAANNWILIAHELGHCLGIDHNLIDSQSLMYVNNKHNQLISIELIEYVKSKIDYNLYGPENVAIPLLEKCSQ